MITLIKQNLQQCWKVAFLSCFALIVGLLPDFAHADAAGALGTMLCNAVQLMQGTPARMVATLAIIVLGIGAFFGKLQWGTAVLVAVGLGLVFGAVAIVTAVGGAGNCGDKKSSLEILMQFASV